jgi:hypothetical protein
MPSSALGSIATSDPIPANAQDHDLLVKMSPLKKLFDRHEPQHRSIISDQFSRFAPEPRTIGRPVTDIVHCCWKPSARFRGTCYRAANWIYVGQTTARGRMDREHNHHLQSIKDIYLYPLHRAARQYLCDYPQR